MYNAGGQRFVVSLRRLHNLTTVSSDMPDTQPHEEIMKNHVFISDRREKSGYVALLIYHHLRDNGFDVFMDIENLKETREARGY
jgi:hypothetical protein